MREVLELRIEEEFAGELLSPREGKHLGDSVRQFTLSTSDPRMAKLAELWQRHRAQGEYFFHGWTFQRYYTMGELRTASLFHLVITRTFEPAGEECGTVYDESDACKHVFRESDCTIQGHRTHSVDYCAAGAKQVSELRLDLNKIPRSTDLARTIANEWVVSQRLAEILTRNKLTGFELQRVSHKGYYEDDPVDLKKYPSGQELLRRAERIEIQQGDWRFDVWLNCPEQKELWMHTLREHLEATQRKEAQRQKLVLTWYQLIVTSNSVPVVPPTRFGIGPFDDDPEGQHRCPQGHVTGLNVLSEVTVSFSARHASDITCTQELVGVRRGLLRPAPLLLISPRLWRLLRDNKAKGYKVEIAHVARHS